MPTGTQRRAMSAGIPASSLHSLNRLSIRLRPMGCPPATILSSWPGKLGLSRARRATHMWIPSALRTKPLRCTPQARMPSGGQAARSICISGGACQSAATGYSSSHQAEISPCSASCRSAPSSAAERDSKLSSRSCTCTASSPTRKTSGQRVSVSARAGRTKPTRAAPIYSGRKPDGSKLLQARMWSR